MAQRISLKQLGNDILHVLGQCFIDSNKVTDYDKDIAVNRSDLLFSNSIVPIASQVDQIQVIFIRGIDNAIIGLATKKAFDKTTDIVTIRATKFGEGTDIDIYESNIKIAGSIGGIVTLQYTELNTTDPIATINKDSFVYDLEGTLAVIESVDKTANTIDIKLLVLAAMPIAPEKKQLVIEEPGTGYTVGEVLPTPTTGIFAQVDKINTVGAIEEVSLHAGPATSTNTSGKIKYDFIIYGAYGKNWAPLANTSTQVAQIISEQFEYEEGDIYTITVPGTGYKVGDIISVNSKFVEVTGVNAGNGIQALRYSRKKAVSTAGTGAIITGTPTTDVAIIPDLVWNDSRRNCYDLTNGEGAHVEFSRLDGVTVRCAAGDGAIFKFTFDDINGVIYQEKTDIASGGGIGPFVPGKQYKKDDVIINDNIIYICKQDHTAAPSLGTDIAYWEEMRKQMTSGMRSVKTQIISQQSSNTLRATQATYVEGDGSMYDAVNCKYIAPVDGLYMMQVDSYTLPNNNSQRRETAIFKDMLNWDNSVSINSGVINLGASVYYVGFLKAGEALIPGHYSVTSGTIDVTRKPYVTFILLTDDRSDNLVAEADVATDTSWTSTFAKNASVPVDYKITTNPSIIALDGTITLPEDGSYIIDADMISTNITTAENAYMFLQKVGDTKLLGSNCQSDSSSYLAPSLSKVITGNKGDTFKLTCQKNINYTEITSVKDAKVRLFKIKSVDYHIDSHDLHKDSGSGLSYEDWVASKLKNEQLTVTATISYPTPANISYTLIPLTYESGETSMINDNEFVAPISGYYNIQMPGIGFTSNADYADSVIVKNDKTSNDWTSVVASASVGKRDAIPAISTNQWLTKGDRISLKARNSSRDTFSQRGTDKATFTLINAGITSTYEVGKPHLWPVNTEVNLGDGLYGKRYQQTITMTKNVRKDIVIDSSTKSYNIISYGGIWHRGHLGTGIYDFLIPGIYIGTTQDVGWSIQVFNDISSVGGLRLQVYDSSESGNTSIDLWITYTK